MHCLCAMYSGIILYILSVRTRVTCMVLYWYTGVYTRMVCILEWCIIGMYMTLLELSCTSVCNPISLDLLLLLSL